MMVLAKTGMPEAVCLLETDMKPDQVRNELETALQEMDDYGKTSKTEKAD